MESTDMSEWRLTIGVNECSKEQIKITETQKQKICISCHNVDSSVKNINQNHHITPNFANLYFLDIRHYERWFPMRSHFLCV